MDITTKLELLDRIYKIYDDWSEALDTACEKYCAHCCTCNVIMTSLEGYKIVKDMISTGSLLLIEKMQRFTKHKRFQPEITINGLAELSTGKEKIPDEQIDPVWGICSLLEDNRCPIYSVRPFGCRCMVSSQKCEKTGYAVMDPVTFTVNNIFLQCIEHIDSIGFTGNIVDVLTFLAVEKNRFEYEKKTLNVPTFTFAANRQIKALMIPPEHRLKVRPVIKALNNINM